MTQGEAELGCQTPEDSGAFSFQILKTLKGILKGPIQEVGWERERPWNPEECSRGHRGPQVSCCSACGKS